MYMQQQQQMQQQRPMPPQHQPMQQQPMQQFHNPNMYMQQQPPPPPQQPVIQEPPPPEQIPSNCLWVGYSAQGVNQDDLKPVFTPFGALESIRPLPDKNCAFVTYLDKRDAWKALQNLQANPASVLGVQLRIGWGKAPSAGAVSSGAGPPSSSLWVGGIPYDVTEEDLRGPFSRFGRIENIKLLAAKKCAFITYPSHVEAGNALREMQGYEIRGERIRVNYGHGGQFGSMKAKMEADQEGRAAPVPQVDPPKNGDTTMIIEFLAEFVNRLGISFEEKVKDEQKSNPRFEFLFGGTGQDYYDWKKYDLSQKEAGTGTANPWSKFTPAPQAAPWGGMMGGGRPGDGNIPDPHAVTLSKAEIARLSTLLEKLVPTQESIKEAKDWVMNRGKLAADIVSFLKAKIAEIPAFTQRLHVLYLVNDVLLHSSRARQEGAPDYYGPAFQRQLFDICAVVLADYAASDEEKKKVIDLVGIWIAKSFYPVDFLEELRKKLQDLAFKSPEGMTKKQKI